MKFKNFPLILNIIKYIIFNLFCEILFCLKFNFVIAENSSPSNCMGRKLDSAVMLKLANLLLRNDLI